MASATGVNSAIFASGGGPLDQIAGDGGDDPLAQAMTAAAADPARLADVLRELASRRVWVPLPDGGPVEAGAAVTLPLLSYRGLTFVPAFTRAALLRHWRPAAALGADSRVPHLVVAAADLAGVLPADVGVALNPGSWPSVAVSPDGLADLTAARGADPVPAPGTAPPRPAALRRAVTRLPAAAAGPVPGGVSARLAAACVALAAIPAVRSATAGWLTARSGDTLVMAVRLDRPADEAVQRSVTAALAGQQHGGCDVEVIFPGASPRGFVDDWVTAFGTLFYQR